MTCFPDRTDRPASPSLLFPLRKGGSAKVSERIADSHSVEMRIDVLIALSLQARLDLLHRRARAASGQVVGPLQ